MVFLFIFYDLMIKPKEIIPLKKVGKLTKLITFEIKQITYNEHTRKFKIYKGS